MSIAILLPTSVLLTLIVAAAQKKRLFPWQQRIDWKRPISGKLPREDWAVICMAAILPAIAVLTAVVFFLADGYMDATTIAILVPSLVLNAMVVAAAYKKRLFPWQEKVSVSDERINPTTGEGMACAKFKIQATMQLVIYLLAPVLACGVVALCSHCITWSTVMLWVKHNSIEPSFENYVRAAVSDMSNMLVAILVTTIIVYFSEVLLYRKKSGGELVRVALSAGPIFCTLLMSWFLFWFLPAALPVVLNHPLPIYSERSMARELLRICSSLSTIFASMAGLAVALSGNEKVIAFVSSVSKFPWCCTAPHELGALEK
ncbi:MAG: hypothetical protein IT342_17835 [Candidatus Melainabacteria bacterium]|nr:hypothetical protein [Candidatus Melainabacteria bacterium]